MSIKKFNSLFGIEADLNQEKQSFVNRINQTVFTDLYKGRLGIDYELAFKRLCYEFGVNADDIISKANRHIYGSKFIPSIRVVTQDDFQLTLKALVVLHELLDATRIERLDYYIGSAISSASTDLGIRWAEGMFYPSGADELDEKLISDNLKWLKEHPKARESFATSLEHFKKSIQNIASRKDAVTNAYTAIEHLAQSVLNNKQNFDKNSDNLVIFLNLPNEYKNILHRYKQIANEYSSRHAGSEFTHAEAEMFIYMTGIFMRVAIQKAHGA